jgi:hypothetical protein
MRLFTLALAGALLALVWGVNSMAKESLQAAAVDPSLDDPEYLRNDSSSTYDPGKEGLAGELTNTSTSTDTNTNRSSAGEGFDLF